MATRQRTLEEIDAEIAETKAALKDVHGTQTEVYARIVGYYRAVRNWNKGKRDEFDHRKLFVYDGTTRETADDCANRTEPATVIVPAAAQEGPSRYECFLRRTCPNCPPVKAYLAGLAMDGAQVDVDSEAGLQAAAAKGVFAAPTVIFYDAQNREIGRAHNVAELDAILAPAVQVAS